VKKQKKKDMALVFIKTCKRWQFSGETRAPLGKIFSGGFVSFQGYASGFAAYQATLKIVGLRDKERDYCFSINIFSFLFCLCFLKKRNKG